MAETVKIHVLKCGRVMVDVALPFGGAQKDITTKEEMIAAICGFRGAQHKIMLSVCAFLIEHPVHGLILVDTGWHTDVRYDEYEVLGDYHYKINQSFLPKGQAIDEQLSVMGLKPSDLDYVLLSHLHTDHVSGVKLVADAKNIMVSDVEKYNAEGPMAQSYESHMWKGVDLKTFHLEDTGYGPHGKSLDLFGDGSVILVSVAGHTEGLCAVQINHNGKFVLLTGDCGYAPKSWKEMIRPGVMWNPEMGMKSLAWVKEMSEKENCVEVLPVHDPDVVPHTIEL